MQFEVNLVKDSFADLHAFTVTDLVRPHSLCSFPNDD